MEKKEKIEVQQILLGILAAAGLISVALFAPNAIQVLKLFNRKNKKYRSVHYINETLGRLKKKGWVTAERCDGQSRIRITKKGEWELLRYTMKEKHLSQKRWDGKWRVVVFDIKEKKRELRDKIREDIKSFGFLRLQDSVWVYPYECGDLIALLKVSCKIGKEVLYMVSEKIENDTWLRQEFRLSKRH